MNACTGIGPGSVTRAGDVNGDGLDDLLVGAPGCAGVSGHAYVIYGEQNNTVPPLYDNADVDLASIGNRGFEITGDGNDDQFGYAVGAAGDVNNDGRDDIVVGAPLADRNALADSGAAYVVYGSQPVGGDVNDLQVSDLTGPADPRGYVISGAEAGDTLGYSVSAGDTNYDGADETIVGAPNGLAGVCPDPGHAYVVYGNTSPGADLADLNAAGTDRPRRLSRLRDQRLHEWNRLPRVLCRRHR